MPYAKGCFRPLTRISPICLALESRRPERKQCAALLDITKIFIAELIKLGLSNIADYMIHFFAYLKIQCGFSDEI